MHRPHRHDDARRVIIENRLKTIPDVMSFMDWKTPNGCHSAGPPELYLLATWPGEYRDDQQVALHQRTVHCQYPEGRDVSVVPRCGAASRRRMNCVRSPTSRQVKISTSMVTGAAHDLLGVKKEDLPAVWPISMMRGWLSGHAYAKGLRTVITSSFGMVSFWHAGFDRPRHQDEKFMWGSWTPAKGTCGFRLSRNVPEATCKDVGVVCVDSGLRFTFAGAPGLHIKGTEFWARSRPRKRRSSHRRADTALSRAGWYPNECTSGAIGSGLDAIASRWSTMSPTAALFSRFAYSQQFSQSDPWRRAPTRRDRTNSPRSRS